MSDALGFAVEFLPPAFVLEADFAAIGLDIRSFREPLKRSIQKVIAPSIAQNFDVGGRPPWEPLAETTVIRRESEGYGGTEPILVRTGKLKKAAQALARWDISQEEASVSNLGPAPYGSFHMTGTEHMPARPFMEIQENDLDKIEDVFILWVEERLIARGFSPYAGV